MIFSALQVFCAINIIFSVHIVRAAYRAAVQRYIAQRIKSVKTQYGSFILKALRNFKLRFENAVLFRKLFYFLLVVTKKGLSIRFFSSSTEYIEHGASICNSGYPSVQSVNFFKLMYIDPLPFSYRLSVSKNASAFN